MNTNFNPYVESKVQFPLVNFPSVLADRFQRIFTITIDDQQRVPNYQTLKVLGGCAVVTGIVGVIASYYFQSDEYLVESISNIAIGALAITHSYYS